MTDAAWLESFDNIETTVVNHASANQEAYDQGFKDAAAECAAKQDHLSEQIAQALADLQFNYVEAQAELITGFGPLLDAIVGQLLPACLDPAFRLQVDTIIQSCVSQQEAGPMEVIVHPSQEDVLRTTVRNHGLDVTFRSDSTLSEHAAWVSCSKQEQYVDLSTVANELSKLLSHIGEPQERTASNE